MQKLHRNVPAICSPGMYLEGGTIAIHVTREHITVPLPTFKWSTMPWCSCLLHNSQLNCTEQQVEFVWVNEHKVNQMFYTRFMKCHALCRIAATSSGSATFTTEHITHAITVVAAAAVCVLWTSSDVCSTDTIKNKVSTAVCPKCVESLFFRIQKSFPLYFRARDCKASAENRGSQLPMCNNNEGRSERRERERKTTPFPHKSGFGSHLSHDGLDERVLPRESGGWRHACNFVLEWAPVKSACEMEVPDTWASVGLVHMHYKNFAVQRNLLNGDCYREVWLIQSCKIPCVIQYPEPVFNYHIRSYTLWSPYLVLPVFPTWLVSCSIICV